MASEKRPEQACPGAVCGSCGGEVVYAVRRRAGSRFITIVFWVLFVATLLVGVAAFNELYNVWVASKHKSAFDAAGVPNDIRRAAIRLGELPKAAETSLTEAQRAAVAAYIDDVSRWRREQKRRALEASGRGEEPTSQPSTEDSSDESPLRSTLKLVANSPGIYAIPFAVFAFLLGILSRVRPSIWYLRCGNCKREILIPPWGSIKPVSTS